MAEKQVIGISVEAVKALISYASRATLTRAEWLALERIDADLEKFMAESKAEPKADEAPKE